MAGEYDSMLGALLDACEMTSVEGLARRVREYAAQSGLGETALYFADLQETQLRMLDVSAASHDGQDTELPINGTVAGSAFTRSLPQRDDEAGCWWVPLLEGVERLGVLRVATTDTDESILPILRRLATLVAVIAAAKRVHSDVYARRVRTHPMSVAAEMQWNLMLPRAYANDNITVSAAFEPAYEMGGDAFDYAVVDESVHLTIFDAMGHDVQAGLIANLAVAAGRNRRRSGAGLRETGRAIEKALDEQLGRFGYITALLMEINCRTGELRWMSHGHHAPVLVRGDEWVDLPCAPGTPLGSHLGVEPTMCCEQLYPGDRLVMYTDGIIETHDPGGVEFGLERFMAFIIDQHAKGLPVLETLRMLVHSILEHHQGRLQDDATVVLLEWHGSSSTGSWVEMR